MHAALPCNEAGTTGTVGPHPSSGALILNAGPVGFVARPCPLRSTAGGGPCAICSASRPARTDGRGAASGSSRSGRASAPHRHRRAGLGGSSVRCCLPVFLAGGGSVRLFLAAPAPPRTVRGGQLVVEILFVWQGRSGTAFPGLPPPPLRGASCCAADSKDCTDSLPAPPVALLRGLGSPPARVWTNHGMERLVT